MDDVCRKKNVIHEYLSATHYVCLIYRRMKRKERIGNAICVRPTTYTYSKIEFIE